MILQTISILVDDYDRAIAYYCTALGFVLLEDRVVSTDKRWVRVAPSAQGTALLLAKATTPRQRAAIGDQAGGRVFLFLETTDFERDFTAMRQRGVTFCEEPRDEPYGMVAVFEDLYGNRWDLIEPR